MGRVPAWSVGAGLLLFPGGIGAQTPPDVRVELTGRVQIQYSTTSVSDADAGEEVAASTFEQRRLRFGAEVEVGDWLTGKVEPEFAGGRLRLADAWIRMDLGPGASLKVGQFKLPFSLLELTSSTRILPIERGVRIRGLGELLGSPEAPGLAGEQYELISGMGYAGRDLGATLGGRVGPLGYELGVFNGSGPDTPDDGDAKTLAGRATLSPMDAPVTLGAGIVSRDVVLDGANERGTAFEVDFEWGRFSAPGLHLMLEAVTGDHLGAADRLAGVQGILAWFIPLDSPRLEGVEWLGRVSWGDPRRDVEDDEGLLLTPGVNIYVHARNRLMLNWDVYLPAAGGLDAVHAIRAQAQVAF